MWKNNILLGFVYTTGNSRVGAQLAVSQEGLLSVEFVG
jgi:hypothetical protein